jgi:hypothetical protein
VSERESDMKGREREIERERVRERKRERERERESDMKGREREREGESDMKGRERENARGQGGCVRDPPAALDPFPLVYTPMGATRSTNLRN